MDKDKNYAETLKLNQTIAEKSIKISNLQKEIDSLNSKIEDESTIDQEEIYDENKIKEEWGIAFDIPEAAGIDAGRDGINIYLKIF